MNESPKFDVNFERTSQLINSANYYVEQLEDTSANAIIKHTWALAKNKPGLPVYTYTQTLLESGVDEVTVKNLCGLLISLKVDINDPHTSSSELSVIIGFMSQELLGTDLSLFRRKVDKVKFNQLAINRFPQESLGRKLVYTDDHLQLYDNLSSLRNWERRLVLSEGSYIDISRKLLETNDEVFETLCRGCLMKIWNDLDIDPQNKATIYFRDLKTYAGDIDFYYWGPEQLKCTLEFSRYLMSLGYKIDHRSNIMVDRLLRDKQLITNSYLGTYLYWYFFMGKAIEFNGDSFYNHYSNDISPLVSIDHIWPSVHKTILDATYIMEQVYTKDLEQYPGFKELPFRLLTGVMMGLSTKYGVPYMLGFEDFLVKIKNHLNIQEIENIRNTFYYINQTRNLYQMITLRRWEMINQEILGEINRLIVNQGGDPVESMMGKYAKWLRDICIRHFDSPINPKIQSLTEAGKEVKGFLVDNYREVGLRYKELSLND